MELRHLYYFNVLAETGSLHRAARQLGLQQPALSQSIRALEADICVQLVERSPAGSRLTQAGKAYLSEVRIILSALDRAGHIARHAATPKRLLRLGIADDIVTSRLKSTLHAFRQPSPDDSVFIVDGSAEQHQSMIRNGLLDLALLPFDTISDQENAVPLWHVELHLALPISHPLADIAVIKIGDLAGVPLILGASDRIAAPDRILTGACHSGGIEPKVTALAHRQEVRLLLVAAGFGLTILPTPSPALTMATGIVSRSLQPPLNMTVGAIWPSSGATPEAKRFLNLARDMEVAALSS